jgi:hypothetical protein
VHFVAGKRRRGVLGQLAPARAGEKREHDHERAEHAATDSFHGFRLPPLNDAPQAETMDEENAERPTPNTERPTPNAQLERRIIRRVARNFLPRKRRGRRRCRGKYYARRF